MGICLLFRPEPETDVKLRGANVGMQDKQRQGRGNFLRSHLQRLYHAFAVALVAGSGKKGDIDDADFVRSHRHGQAAHRFAVQFDDEVHRIRMLLAVALALRLKLHFDQGFDEFVVGIQQAQVFAGGAVKVFDEAFVAGSFGADRQAVRQVAVGVEHVVFNE